MEKLLPFLVILVPCRAVLIAAESRPNLLSIAADDMRARS